MATVEQERALAMATARLRLQQQAEPDHPEPEAVPEPEPRTLSEKVWRGLSLGGRYLAETPGLAVASMSDVLAKGTNKALSVTPIDYRLPENRAETVREGFTNMGFPETPGGLAEAIPRGVVGLGFGIGAGQSMAGAANPIVRGVGQVFAESPGMQAASLASGETAGTVAERAGAGPGGQMAARLAGSMLPSAALYAGSAGVRGAFRGGEQGRQNMAETIDDFSRVGAKPTVGQATQGRVARATESGLSRAPGGAGRMAKTAQQQADDVARNIEEKAIALAGKTSAERAGRTISTKVSGQGGFIESFKGKQNQLYDKLDDFIAQGDRVDVSKTKEALASLNADIPGAPALSRFFQNSKIKSIQAALKADTEGLSSVKANPQFAGLFDDIDADDARLIGEVMQDGKLPYEALKKLRSLVGREMADSGFGSDIPRSKWKPLYAALSDDLERAAKSAKDPKAYQAWQRANSYTRAGHARLDAIENVIKRKGGPEKIFQAATSGTKEGATTLRSVMQSVDDEGKKVISATVLRRMGLARPSSQNELGDLFSTETFLTNWNQLSREAKSTLFGRYGGRFSRDMDAVASFASNLREGSKVFVNPSGTAQAAAQQYTAGAFALSVLTGQAGAAGAIAGGVVGANRLAALMTKPEFVRWLATTTTMSQAAIPAQINLLAKQAAETNDEDLAFAATLLQESYDQQSKGNDGRQQR